MIMASTRRPIIFNRRAKQWNCPLAVDADAAFAFHRQHFDYEPTELVPLDSVANEIGVKAVYLKSEKSRFGLPSFKILGASWGVFRAIAQRFNLSLDADLATVKHVLAGSNVTLYAATDGNHGRAVARMAAILNTSAQIHVPYGLNRATIKAIQNEGAKVVVSEGNYDVAIAEAHQASRHASGLLIQDYAFGNYFQVPQWIVDGYQTMMREIDEQLDGLEPDLVIAPVGVGSFAQAVVSHYRQAGRASAVVTVEPDTAACIWKSFQYGEPISKVNTPTIMAGLDCGTPSKIAWPVLRNGVVASITISDYESHTACQRLNQLGVSAGPCGAASLAALLRMTPEERSQLNLNAQSTIVLLSTEATRGYETPYDVAISDPEELAHVLTQISSIKEPLSDAVDGETRVTRFVCAWLEHRDIDTHSIQLIERQPPVILELGRSISPDPLPLINGKAYGSTSQESKSNNQQVPIEMKSGLAAALIDAVNARRATGVSGTLFAAFPDEESAPAIS